VAKYSYLKSSIKGKGDHEKVLEIEDNMYKFISFYISDILAQTIVFGR
jgi:hypothetical protein